MTQHEKIIRMCLDGRDTMGRFMVGHKNGMTGKRHNEQTKKKIGDANAIALKGKILSAETRRKMSIAAPKTKSIAHRKAMSEARKGVKSQWWRDGRSKENHIIRESVEIKLWRESVFKRDDYTCQICGVHSGNAKRVTLNADHIKPFAYFPELRFELSNGRTLCVDCHKKTDTFGRKAINIYEKNSTSKNYRVMQG